MHRVSIKCFVLVGLVAITTPCTPQEQQNRVGPLPVLQSYLRAIYARDYTEAYRYLSVNDRDVRDLNRYLKQRGPFAGFALEVAKKLSEAIEIDLIDRRDAATRLWAVVRYKVPDPNKLAALLLNWDAYRLNALAPHERKRILEAIEKQQRDGSMEVTEGEEQFELIREGGTWRVFLNWAAGVKIPFRLDLSKSVGLEATLSSSEIVTQPGELFAIELGVKNRLNQPVTVRIGHLIEPESMVNFVDFVQCGFLLPVTIGPASEEKFSGTYSLRGNLPEGVRQISLTYDFHSLK